MGFFDKIKSMTNAITGGAAKVDVDVRDFSHDKPFTVVVHALSKGAVVKYDKVYLLIEGVEEVSVPGSEVKTAGENQKAQDVSVTSSTLQMEVIVAPAGSLDANASGEWTTQVTLPTTAQPVFSGKHAKYYYRVQAALDCFGNDPDSGWKRI